MHLHDLPAFARPREKLSLTGGDGLRTAELLAILLRTGYRGQNAIQVAEKLLQRFTLTELAELPLPDLAKLKGVGPSRAATIKTAFYLAQLLSQPTPRQTIHQPEDAIKLCHDLITKRQEHVIGLYLDARHQLLQRQTITVGTVDSSLLHPREVYALALETRASGVIIIHNHPSGNPDPSAEDLEATDKLTAAGEVLDIPLFDHLIIAKDGWRSLRQLGHIC